MFHGFQITHKIHETDQSVIFRAIRSEDGLPVVLKMLDSQYPTPRELARYRQEHDIISALDGAGAIRAYGLERHKNTVYIVLEDFGGSALSLLFDQRPPSVEQFLALSIQICTALGKIHQRGVIHKDINPSNIVWNPQTDRLEIIDFGIATRLTSESPALKSPSILEGTLPYISPEQTGRMNRHVDYRTDLYSLGATLYELLTGQLPFEKRDALELVHCHIAARPRPPIELRQDIPPILSQIILKLLAKTAEERYQSAWGIKADLEACLAQLRAGREVIDLPLASGEFSDRFRIPQKLYGRSRESRALLETFERVGEGRSEIALVTGYSGIGKSSLVRELYRPITRRNAFFVSGKFDLLQRSTPYSAISATLSELVKQLLTGSKEELAQWKEELLAALGPNGRILVDLIPELEMVIGAQSEVEELGPIEAQNRLSLAFCSFLRVFCTPAHPLVIFLDDLQWADSATLRLLEPMMADADIDHLLLIGAYRDNEVDSAHPLVMTLKSIEARDVPIHEINLQPLSLGDITELLADTLRQSPDAVGALADLVLRRTGGNPFFVNEFAKMLHESGLLRFGASLPGWEWDMAEIEATQATDNVADLLSSKLRRFPEQIQNTLRLAACIGNRFDLHTISIIADQPVQDTFAALMEAVREGVLYPVSDPELIAPEALAGAPPTGSNTQLVIREHRFVHDRVQQAAYALIPAERQGSIHLDIGRLLLAKLSPAEREERLFELVDHLNLGRSLLGTSSDRDPLTRMELARLDLAAGLRAKEAAAFGAAARYLAIGIELAGQAWEEDHALALDLHVEGAEAEYCSGDFERSQALIEVALGKAGSILTRARLYQILIVQYTNQARFEDAFRVARAALQMLGQSLPLPGESAAALEQELAEVSRILGDRPIESLLDEPEMVADTHRAAVEIMAVLGPTAFQADADLFNFLAARIVKLLLQHGQTVAGAFGYAIYGMALGTRFRDYRRGYDFGALALRLADRFHSAAAKGKVGEVMIAHVHHWARPLKDAHAISIEAFEAALQSGELQFAAFILMDRLINHFYQGVSLDSILDESGSYLRFGQNNNNTVVANTIEAFRIGAAHLSEPLGRDGILALDEDAAFIDRCKRDVSLFALGLYYVLKCQILYLFQEHERAIEAAIEGEKLLAYIPGMFSEATLVLYHALSLAALFADAPPERRAERWEALEAHRARMQIWVESCPENFLHMQALMAAEMARITGDDLTAIRSYNQAIEAAEKHEFPHEQALASELAARFWLDRGNTRYALSHLRDAHYGYGQWGARRKLAMLEEQHAELLMQPWKEGGRASGRITTTHPSVNSRSLADKLDLSSVIKASQALSSEIALDKLLASLIGIVMENAGAQHGYLILKRKDRLVIEAQGSLGQDIVHVMHSLPLDGGGGRRPPVSTAIVNYVLRSREIVVLHDATQEGPFVNDAHVVETQPKSILCMPLLNQGKVNGALYLENNLSSEAFTPERVELLRLLSSQMAISLDNSLLYGSLHQASQDLERILHGIAHDLKEPLRAIQSFSELLIRRYGAQIELRGRDYLTRIVMAARRLGSLLDAIRTVSEIRRAEGPRQQVAGALLVQEALRGLQPAIGEKQATVHVAADLPRLTVDRRWAVEAIHQVLRNALQHAIPGAPPAIEVVPYEGSEGIGMVIRDRGQGVPEEDAEKVFELFQRVGGRGDAQGAGAGLAIVRQIAARHGGNAWLRPRAGGGSDLYLTFGD